MKRADVGCLDRGCYILCSVPTCGSGFAATFSGRRCARRYLAQPGRLYRDVLHSLPAALFRRQVESGRAMAPTWMGSPLRSNPAQLFSIRTHRFWTGRPRNAPAPHPEVEAGRRPLGGAGIDLQDDRNSVVAWIGVEMEFALSQAVASGGAFEHGPSECGHCVQNFLAGLDLRDLPGEAAGFELGADDALPTADLRFYPAALVVPCGRLPGYAAGAAESTVTTQSSSWTSVSFGRITTRSP